MPYVPPSPIARGTFANRPTAGHAGRVYYVTDGPVSFVDDGTTWQPFIAKGNLTNVPLASAFTQVNAGGRSTTLSDSKGGLLMQMTNANSSDDYRLAKIASPGGAYSTTAHFYPMLTSAVNSAMGLCWRKASSGSATFFGIVTATAGTSFLMIRNETTNNNGTSPAFTFSSDEITAAVCQEMMWGDGIWLRQTDDGSTNKTWNYSLDGQNFVQLFTIGRTHFVTPDETGIFVANIAAGSTNNGTAFIDSYVTG